VQYIPIILEHVDLLDVSYGGNVQLLECSLEFPVVSLRSGLGLLDHFTSGCTFASCILTPNTNERSE
jgi:hypothetical protein